MSEDVALAEQSALAARPTSTGWWRGRCLICALRTGKPDRKGAFGYNPETGGYSCFKCGSKGRLRSVFRPQSREVADSLARLGDADPKPEGYMPLWEEPLATAISAEPARDYLHGRGVGPKLWKEARIGACIRGRHAGRVIVPIIDSQDKWQGWVGRAWRGDVEKPYLYPRGMKRAELMYNDAALDERTSEPVMVVEGVFDALALWPDAVAVLGKPSAWQVGALVAASRPIAVVLDGDAWREGEALAMSLRLHGQRAGFVRLPPRVDPDEVPKDELRAMARDCIQEA